ncbi:MAG: response regulator, partial [Dehalococcoidia bacterium]|nr:response regulator [Dehalococcoidia bacterium]
MTKALILNVDDYDPARYARSLLLRQAGFDVKEAVNGNEALRVAVNEGPEVVLLDVNLPDMSGFEVCRRLKADPVTACVSVLHVSATQVAPRDAAVGLEGGADAYLVEPVDPAVLV